MGPTATAMPTSMSASEVATLSTGQIMDLFAESSAALASLAGLVCLLGGELERRQGYRDEGADSLESWMVARAGVSAATARTYSALGERLFDLPHLAAALSSGAISLDKVRAVAAVATSESDAEWAQAAGELSVRDLSALARAERRPRSDTSASEHEARSLRCNDARRTLSAQLPEADYVAVRNALEARAKALGSDQETPWDRRMADALVSLVRSGSAPSGAPSPYSVVAHVPLEVLLDASSPLCGELERGGLIDAEVVRALACDATLIIGVDDDVGHTLYEGRQSRDATPTQRREILRRDRHCRFPGCDHVLFWVPHHIKEWRRHRGPTDLDNLCCLCAYHHHLVHSRGWTLSGDANAELSFAGPNGRVMTSRPSPLWTRVTRPVTRPATKTPRG
jgi:Domain of unknown function (DUF222)